MKFFKKFIALSMSCLVLVSTFASCGDDTTGEGFALPHFNGMDIEEYDTDLLWRNTSEVVNDGGGDGDVMWVSEEDDPVNGGYFYLYSTFGGGDMFTEDHKRPSDTNGKAAYRGYVTVARSKDMVDWQPCGALAQNYCLRAPVGGWIQSHMYAPECIYDPVSEKYYLYVTALSKVNNPELRAQGARYSDSTANTWDRFYIGVGVSETPYGPFDFATSEMMYGDPLAKNPNGYVLSDVNPTILIDEECDELFYNDEFMAQFEKADGSFDQAAFDKVDERIAVIDVNPFFDENGDLYLYFCRHMASDSPGGHNIWGFKMKDMVTPDYTTIFNAVRGSNSSQYTGTSMEGNADAGATAKIVRVEYGGERTYSWGDKGEMKTDLMKPPHLAYSWKGYTRYADGTESKDGQYESMLIEAPNVTMTKDKDGKTVYIMAYSPLGVDRVEGDYDMKAAYSYSPLGPFIKPNPDQGARILATDSKVNDFMSNLGHASFVEVDDEIWIAHWQRQTPFGGLDQGRLYALSACSFQYIESTGIYMPIANGPTTSLQPKVAHASGYKNVALGAKIQATNEIGGSTKYLNDGMWVTDGIWVDREFKAEQSTKITITFDSPKAVRGILIYNSYSTENAFKNVSLVQFELAQTPDWYTASQAASCYIQNLPYNVDAYKNQKNVLQPGSAAVATFNEIKVDKITVTITQDDLHAVGAEELRISEIVVLGK